MASHPANPIAVGCTPELTGYARPAALEETPLRFIFDIRAAKADAAGASSGALRVPVDVVAALDVSFSMRGAPLALLKEATELLLEDDTLGRKDALGLLSFSSDFTEEAPLAPLTAPARVAALAAVGKLCAVAGTNLYGAILEAVGKLRAYGAAAPPPAPAPWAGAGAGAGSSSTAADAAPAPAAAAATGRSRAVVVFSDGQHYTGDATLAECVAAALAAGVPIHAIGLGPGHDVRAMSSLARGSGGLYAAISDNEAISDVVATLLERMQDARAQGAVLELALTPSLAAAGAGIDVAAATSPFPITPLARSAEGRVTAVRVVLGDVTAGDLRELALPVVLPATDAGVGVLAAAADGRPRCVPVLSGSVTYADLLSGRDACLPVAAAVTVVTPATQTAFTPGFGLNALELRASSGMADALRCQLQDAGSAGKVGAKAALLNCLATLHAWQAHYLVADAAAAPVVKGVDDALADLNGGKDQDFATAAVAYAAQSSSAAGAAGKAAAPKYAGGSRMGGPKAMLYSVGKAGKRRRY
jgi:hypothetical protein